jgi:hypothetical protein
MRQFDLFARARCSVHVPQSPDPEAVRLRLLGILDHLRLATQMPWQPWQLQSWQQVFYNMANWLSPEERDRLRQEFTRQIERLQQT